MPATTRAFVPNFLKTSQAQEFCPYTITGFADQYGTYNTNPPYTISNFADQYGAYNSMLQFPVATDVCNLISLDAYSDDESEDEPSAPNQAKSPCPSLCGGSTPSCSGESDAEHVELSDTETSDLEFLSTCSDNDDEDDLHATNHIKSPCDSDSLGFERHSSDLECKKISIATFLKLRGTVDVESKHAWPLWMMQPVASEQNATKSNSHRVSVLLTNAPWRKAATKAAFRPPPGLEHILSDTFEEACDRDCQVFKPPPGLEDIDIESLCLSTCDGSSVGCSGESARDSESETDQEFESTVDASSKPPWRMQSMAPATVTMTTKSDVPSFDVSQRVAPLRKHVSKAQTTEREAKVAPWRRDST